MDVYELIESIAARFPDEVAIVEGDGHLTYASLMENAARVGAALRERGVGRGDIVAISLPRGTAAITAMLGILHAGAAWLPLDRDHPQARRTRILDRVAPVLEVTTSAADGPGTVRQSTLDALLAAGEPVGRIRVGADDPAYVIVTSGSTGEPKPVVVPRRALTHYCRAASEVYGPGPGDRVLQFASLSFDASIEEIFLPLCAGATVVVRDEQMIGRPDLFLGTCGSWQISVLGLPTAYWLELLVALEQGEVDLPPGLRTVVIGGEAVRADAVRRWRRHAVPGVRLINSYGPTETTVVATTADLSGWDGEDPVPIGRPLPGVTCRVVDVETGAEAEDGELWIGGPAVATGYLGDDDLTAARFMQQPGSGREYRSGDRVRRRPDGELEYLGRLDRQVKLRGFRVEPGEVEAALARAPGVLEAAVEVGDLDGRPILRAHLLAAGGTGQTVDPAVVREHVARQLPAFLRPHSITVHPTFPRTVSGKIDREALAALHPTAPAARPGPGHETVADGGAVRRIWAELLGVDSVTDDDHFFEQGGDSLAVIRLVTRLHREHGLEIDMAEVLARPRFQDVASAVRAAAREVTPAEIDDAETGDLTPLQRDFVISEHLVELPVHTLGIRYRLPQPVEPDRLRHLLRRLARRHPALRQRIQFDGDRPGRVVAADVEVPLETLDLRAEPTEEADRRAGQARRAATRVPFDLSSGELPVRALLLRQATGDELVLVVHHIGFDGWSVATFGDDLGSLLAETDSTEHTDAARGRAAASALTGLVRRDTAAAQNADLVGYWRQRLAGLDTSWALPADRLRPAQRTFAVERVARTLEDRQVRRWHDLARRHHTSLFVVALAAIQTLVHRYTGVTDVTVLAPTARRGGHPDAVDLVGPVVNVLPLRGDLGDDPSMTQLVHRLAIAVVEDLAHQDLPTPGIVAAAELPVGRGRNRLSTVSLSVHNLPEPTAGGVCYAGDEPPAASTLDLAVAIDIAGGHTLLTLDYATELFDERTITAIGDHLVTLLDAACRNPELPISRLPMLSDAERHAILEEHQGSDLAGIDVPPMHGVHEYVERWARETPDAPALLVDGATVSYAEFDAAANRLAHQLVAQGAGPGVLVGICLERDLDLFVAPWAVLKTGAAYLPLDPAYPSERLGMMLADSDAGMLLTRGDVDIPEPPAGVQVVRLDQFAGDDHDDVRPLPRVAAGTPAYMIYTSGSTGRPKGVVITHDRLIALVAGWQHHYGLRPEWSYLQVASFSFDMFVAETFRGLCTGGRVVVAPREVLLRPESLAELIRTEQVGFFELVPAVLRQLLDHLDATGGGLPSMRMLIGGGEKWHVGEYKLARRIVGAHARVANAYGVTEVTVDNTVFEGEVDDLPDDAPLPIGRPFPGQRVHVLDRHGEPVPHNVIGELYLGGFGVAEGYHRRPELTAERFVPDPNRPGGRLYRTGDSARRRPDGVVAFLGRLDDQVKINGHRIELGEVEAALTALPGVQAAAAAVHPNARGIDQLIGYVVTRDQQEGSEDRIRAALAARLPRHLVPARILTLETLPATPNGKLDRRALPAPTDRVAARVGERTPLNPVEQRVAHAWAEVLGVADALEPEDDFFALGGDSFAALRVVRRLDAEVTLIELYQNPTVRGLAAVLAEKAPRGTGLLHRLTPGDADIGAGGVTVVAVPYSGGNAIAYRPLALALPATWALHAVELPGHDPTSPEQPLQAAEQVAARVVEEMAELSGPLMLYGHCLGVAVTVEIARQAEARGLNLAGVGLGAGFPTARLPGRLLDRIYRFLPTDRFTSNRELMAYLRGRGGFTDLTDTDDTEFALRNVRHDARDAERYFTDLYRDENVEPLRAPVRSIVGSRDRVTEHHEERMHEWAHVASEVDQAVLPDAGHFFIGTHSAELAEALTDLATPERARSSPVPAPPPGPEPRLGLFGLVTAGQLVSMVGSGLSAFVMSIWVFAQTGSAGAFAVLSAVAVLPGVLLGPIGGAVADRWDRRRVMIASDVGSAVAVAGVALLILLGGLQLWHVFLAVTITSVAGAFQRPAYLAAVAQMVPKRYLGHANGISQIGVGISAVFGPLLGAGLYAMIGIGGVLVVDLATFLVGVTTLLWARIPDLAFHRREENFRTEISRGWAYIVRRPGLRAAMWFFTVDQLLFALGFAVVTPMLLVEHSAGAAGLALAAGGVGGLVGALVMGLWGGTAQRMHGVLLAMAAASAGMALVGVFPAVWCATIGLFGLALGVAVAEAHFIAMIQTKVGFELQGRVLALYLSVMMLATPLGFLIVAPLADTWVRPLLEPGGGLASSVGQVLGTGPGRGFAFLVVLSGLAQLAWAWWGWRNPVLRDLERTLPDALPPPRLADKDEMQRLADEQLAATRA
ncbi:amino acid adenylation domain-containing protein [Micromonospora sp. NPDC004704]